MHKREIRGLLSAMLLGDGSLSCKYNTHRKGQDKNDLTGISVTYHMTHSGAQEDYLDWKIKQIDKIFEEKNLPRRCNRKNSYISKLTGRSLFQTSLAWTKYFRIIYPKIYKMKDGKRKKTLQWLLDQIYNDLHLFVWVADDGCEMWNGKANPSYRLHINNFTEGEAKIAQQWFKVKYGIEPRITMWKGGSGNLSPVLMFRVKEAQVIWNRISPYVMQIDSMKHKFRGSIAMWNNCIKDVNRSLEESKDEKTVQIG